MKRVQPSSVVSVGLLAAVALLATTAARAQQGHGSIVGWGSQVFGVDLNRGFVKVAAGDWHSLGLKADGSIVAWGSNNYAQCSVPEPNAGFVAVAAGGYHSLGLKADGSIAAWGYNLYGQCSVPAPNAGFVALAGGGHHSLGLKADGSIVAWGTTFATASATSRRRTRSLWRWREAGSTVSA